MQPDEDRVDWLVDEFWWQSQSVAVPGQGRNSSMVLKAVDAVMRLLVACGEVNAVAIFSCGHCSQQQVKFVVVERL